MLKYAYMEICHFNTINKKIVLALGAESAGNFSLFKNEKIYLSQYFGDLSKEENYLKFQNSVQGFLKKNEINPQIILSDLHPLFNTTIFAKKLAKKYSAAYLPIQHHLAHIFSSLGDRIIHNQQNKKYKIPRIIYGIACDGTGMGLDGKIWGGEIFKIRKSIRSKRQNLRIGHMENHILIGGESAIKEPARMLIAILGKFMDKKSIFNLEKKYYTKNEFTVLYNQWLQKFNCVETSSTARVLDAVSLLLGFCKNKSGYKHEPVDLLEKNSTIPYKNLTPIIAAETPKASGDNTKLILQTTPLFKYLVKHLAKDKKRLAATAQKYLADGLVKIVKKYDQNMEYPSMSGKIPNIYFAGGMADNKIMTKIIQAQGTYINKKIPYGDAGISFGQIVYYLSTNSRD
jgi:hydrogenase maturation protein HypF